MPLNLVLRTEVYTNELWISVCNAFQKDLGKISDRMAIPNEVPLDVRLPTIRLFIARLRFYVRLLRRLLRLKQRSQAAFVRIRKKRQRLLSRIANLANNEQGERDRRAIGTLLVKVREKLEDTIQKQLKKKEKTDELNKNILKLAKQYKEALGKLSNSIALKEAIIDEIKESLPALQ